MNLKLNRLVLSLLASVAVLPKSALAFTTAVGSQLKTDKSDLTKQLIEKKMFLINPETDEIVLDESKILRTIREEIKTKLLKNSSDKSQLLIYEQLLNNLKPGQFERENNDFGYGSMDFNKG